MKHKNKGITFQNRLAFLTGIGVLVCMMIIGTATAISSIPDSVQVVKPIVPSTTTQIIKAPVSIQPVEITTADVWITVNINSVPSGATVTIDGYTQPDSATPSKWALRPGDHTILLSLDNYQDNTTKISLKAGMPSQDITVYLKPVSISPSKLQDVKAVISSSAVTLTQIPASVQTASVISRVSPALAREPATEETDKATLNRTQIHLPASIMKLKVTIAPPVACPNSDWTCLQLAEAEQQFGFPLAQYGNDPCDYQEVNNQTVAKYCFMDLPSSESLSPQILGARGIREGADIYLMNDTVVKHGIVNTSLVQKAASSEKPSLIQSFFDFFANILSGNKKPELRLEIVGFDPQPEPPGVQQLL